MSEQYTVLPEFYDRLNTEADYSAYLDYLDSLLPKACNLIDLGCGTGEISIGLARLGHKVTALDISPEMLSEAHHKSVTRGTDVFFTCQDMTSFCVPHKYDAVVSCFDSLNYILSKDKLQSTFLCVNNALEPGGLFLFDMNAPAKFEKVYADNTFVIEEDGIFCVWENEYNAKSRRCRFYIDIFVNNKTAWDRYSEIQTEKSYKLSDILNTLEKAGFDTCSIGSDFDGCPIDENTHRYYFVARKKI